LESVEFYNIDEVVEYALLLNNATTVAKLGFFLEMNDKRFFVDQKHLKTLQERIPKKPHYMDKHLKGRYISKWSLIVPDMILERSWSEVL
jgi:hypothetical protein